MARLRDDAPRRRSFDPDEMREMRHGPATEWDRPRPSAFRDNEDMQEAYDVLYRRRLLTSLREHGHTAWALEHLERDPAVRKENRAAVRRRKEWRRRIASKETA